MKNGPGRYLEGPLKLVLLAGLFLVVLALYSACTG